MSTTMLYKLGIMIQCGAHSVDYIIVNDEDVDESVKAGWVKTPDETVEKPKKVKAAKNGENEG